MWIWRPRWWLLGSPAALWLSCLSLRVSSSPSQLVCSLRHFRWPVLSRAGRDTLSDRPGPRLRSGLARLAKDPSITLANGLKVKSSNYRGVRIGGTTYYYSLSPRPSYDPLARGEVTSDQINVVVIRGDYPNRVMIYTIPIAIPSSRPASSRSAS